MRLCGPALRTTHDVGQADRLVEVVGDEEDRAVPARAQLEQVHLHDVARLRVEVGERLVHEDHRRVVDQRLRDGRPLASSRRTAAPGSCSRTARARPDAATPPYVRGPPAPGPSAAAGRARCCRARSARAAGRRPGRGSRRRGSSRRTGSPASIDLAGRGRGQPGHHAQQGRLAAPARPDDRDEVAGRDVEADRPERRVHLAVRLVEVLHHVPQDDHRRLDAARFGRRRRPPWSAATNRLLKTLVGVDVLGQGPRRLLHVDHPLHRALVERQLGREEVVLHLVQPGGEDGQVLRRASSCSGRILTISAPGLRPHPFVRLGERPDQLRQRLGPLLDDVRDGC